MENNISNLLQRLDEFLKAKTKPLRSKPVKRLGMSIEAAVSVFFGILFLVLINIFWNKLPFILPTFIILLPLINLSSIVNIILNFMRIFLPFTFVKILVNMVSLAFGIFVTWMMYTIYPFDFNKVIGISNIDSIFKFVFLIVLLGTFIGLIVEFIRLVYLSINLAED